MPQICTHSVILLVMLVIEQSYMAEMFMHAWSCSCMAKIVGVMHTHQFDVPMFAM